ncbi:MAG: S41 family peptidase, partial [Mucilaginibacter sp.]
GDIEPDGKQYYSKPVVLLVSARTFSAAEDFTVAFNYLQRGKLIGQTTGGSTGQPISFDLPGGGSARVCGKHDTYPDGKEFIGVGIIPDITIKKTVKDLWAGTDAVLEKALSVLK